MLSRFLHRAQPYAAVFIRLVFGYHLVQYSAGEILGGQAHLSMGPYLASLGVPFPGVAAWLAMGTEFFGGLLLIVGLAVRPVSILLAINFLVAVLLVHLHQPYTKSFEAIQMLAVALFFLLHGAGALSLDQELANRRRQAPPVPA